MKYHEPNKKDKSDIMSLCVLVGFAIIWTIAIAITGIRHNKDQQPYHVIDRETVTIVHRDGI